MWAIAFQLKYYICILWYFVNFDNVLTWLDLVPKLPKSQLNVLWSLWYLCDLSQLKQISYWLKCLWGFNSLKAYGCTSIKHGFSSKDPVCKIFIRLEELIACPQQHSFRSIKEHSAGIKRIFLWFYDWSFFIYLFILLPRGMCCRHTINWHWNLDLASTW